MVGPYELQGRIGSGGMGTVYLGTSPNGEQVAVKVIRADLAGDAQFLARFQDEVANARRVASFATAQVLDQGTRDGLAYMVTEYIDGRSLADHVTRHGALSPGLLHGVAVGVATALTAIHSAGLIHRDLKPSNVLLSLTGPRVIDFGIARALDATTAHTATGMLVGSPGWMAPEQILHTEITTAVDIFAWGCLIAQAGTSRHPFGTGNLAVLSARLLHAEPDIGPLPEPLAGLVRAALQKDPRSRPSAQDLLLTLVSGNVPQAPAPLAAAAQETVAQNWQPVQTPPPGRTPEPFRPHQPHGAYPPPPPVPGQQWTQIQPGGNGRRKAAIAAVAALVLVAAGVSVFAFWPEGKKDEPTDTVASPDVLPTSPIYGRMDLVAVGKGECSSIVVRLTPGKSEYDKITAGTCDSLPQYSAKTGIIAYTHTTGTDPNRSSTLQTIDPKNGSRSSLDLPMKTGTRSAWSPDGDRLAFMRLDTAGVPQIYTATATGSDIRQLTTSKAEKDDPAWSPDGTKIAFWAKEGVRNQIFYLDVANPSAVTQVTHEDTHRAGDPAWSPDSARLAYTRSSVAKNEGEEHDIWSIAADGTDARAVTSAPGREMDPYWSRNGKWISYVKGALDKVRVYAIRADGSEDTPISPENIPMSHPNWT
ncbi:hypothetical protein GCM10010468_01400 [Actinocorallia longicatena]|uniref:Protein kinase domain-containing protein n=1 Tax=Actinocorallia longicatena TaxID=111803 RepID=A0ABP6PVD4_9ACTN